MDHNEIQHSRLKYLIGFLAVVLLLYLGVLYDTQVNNHDYYSAQAVHSIARKETVEASRGIVTDRNGQVMVSNRSAYSLTFDASLLKEGEDENEAILRLVQLCEAQGVDWVDNLPLSKTEPLYYTVNSAGDQQTGRFLTYLKSLAPARKALGQYLLQHPDLVELSDESDQDSETDGDDAVTLPSADDFVDALTTSHLTETLLRSAGITPLTLLGWMREEVGIPENYTNQEARLIVGVQYELALRKLDNYTAYFLAEDVDTELISMISDGNYAGAKISSTSIREYDTTYAAHILGIMGHIDSKEEKEALGEGYSWDDQVGKSGVESAFEEYLKGTDGLRVVSTNSEGSITGEYYSVEPQPGNTVELTIDLDLQAAVESALAETVERLNNDPKYAGDADTRGAGAAVIKVDSGEILSLASYPTYDPAEYRSNYTELSSNPANPLSNRATSGTYAPGSTLKPLTAVAALEEGLISLTDTIRDTGRWLYPNDPTHSGANCWIGYPGHGSINVTKAITVSCNYFFAEMGYQLGMDKFNGYLSAFGLGESTGIEIGERTGLQPKNEQGQDQTPWAAFGQSNQLYTPLQLANYIATLVSGGEHHEAHLLKTVKSYDNSEIIATGNTEPVNVVDMSEGTLNAIKTGMHDLTTSSLAAYFNNCVVSAGAKTGTAQVGADTTNNGVFVCFAPYEDPEIALAIVIEKGGSGSALASTAVNILNAYFAPEEIGTAIIGENQLLP